MAKDHWTSSAYQSAAAFVPQLTSKVVKYLDPQPSDHILDIGCGDGPLTAQIAQACPQGRVLGLDASASFIATAQTSHTSPNCTFRLQDCTQLSQCEDVVDGSWDKVFSNAAMHWILRAPGTRQSFFRDVHAALKPGGRFVFEQGGGGNVAEVQAAAVSALRHAGLSLEAAREASPWFFPTTAWMESTLKEAGFEVETCELEYRPTRLTADGKGGGLEGWARLFCAQFLEAVEEGKREGVLGEICEILESVIAREEGVDGGKYLGYVRLRAMARRKG